MKYYLGVDGGGTKTAFALFDENKAMIASYKGPASNHENMEGSFDEAADVLKAGVDELLRQAGVPYSALGGVLMGLAGIDHPYQHDAMMAALEARGITGARVYNDGFIVIKAGIGAGAGIGYNCGTGTVCNAIDSDGELRQVGGLAELSGDKGNGHWIAAEVFRVLYDDIVLDARRSLVRTLLEEKEGPQTTETLMARIAALETPDGEEQIRLMIDLFFAAVARGDMAALEIQEAMAERGADYIAALAKQLRFDMDEIPVVLSGSIHVKLPADAYLARLQELTAAKAGRKFRFIKLQNAPVTGCVNWLLESEA